MTWAIKGESSYKDSVSLLTTSLPISLATALFSVMTSTTSVSCCAGQPTHRPAAAVLDHAVADAAKPLSVPRPPSVSSASAADPPFPTFSEFGPHAKPLLYIRARNAFSGVGPIRSHHSRQRFSGNANTLFIAT